MAASRWPSTARAAGRRSRTWSCTRRAVRRRSMRPARCRARPSQRSRTSLVVGRFERLHPQLFRERHPDSALWQWLVNGVAASPAWTPRERAALLRRGGIDVRSAQIQPGCWFFSTQIEFGDWVWINHRAYFDTRDWIRIGDRVGFGPEVMVITSTHEPGD